LFLVIVIEFYGFYVFCNVLLRFVYGFPLVFLDFFPNWGHSCLAEVGTGIIAEAGT
jgi:hypothetical protein